MDSWKPLELLGWRDTQTTKRLGGILSWRSQVSSWMGDTYLIAHQECLYDSGGVVFDHTAEMLRNIQKLRFIIIGDDIDAELVPMGFL